MFEAYSKTFKNYANFNGRTSRREYWYYILANMLIAVAIWIIDGNFLTGGIIYGLYCLVWMVPATAACIRRLHDTGHSGWFCLLPITIIGVIPVLIWLCQPGTPGVNKYGPDPNGGYAPIPDQPGYPDHTVPVSGVSSVSCIAGSMCGRVYPIVGTEMLLGRDVSAWIRFPDNEPGVSRAHCTLIRNSSGQLMLLDCGSTYGTFVSGVGKLSPQQPVTLQRGTTFYLGSKKVGFRVQ